MLITSIHVKTLGHMNTYHQGRNKAIKRETLLGYLQGIGYMDLEDRQLRKIIKDLKCICPSPEGYYVPLTKDEADYGIEYLKKKIYPLFEDIKNIRESYPQFYKGTQLELFDEK